MNRRDHPAARGIFSTRRIVRSALLLAILAGAFIPPTLVTGEELRNVALHVIPREILFFSAQAGVWTSIRLDAGERVLQSGADGNVAAVVTSQRAIGFSAATGRWADVERFQSGR